MSTHPRSTVSAIAGLTAALAACAISTGAAAADSVPQRPTTITQTRFAVDDAYVDSNHPRRSTGEANRLIAGHGLRQSQTALAKFRVPTAPAGYVLRDARLHLSVIRTNNARVLVQSVSNRWRGGTVSYSSRVRGGRVVASSPVRAGQRSLDLHVTRGLTAGTVSFALAVTKGATVVTSSDGSSRRAPRLVLSYRQAPAPATAAAATSVALSPLKIGMSAPAAQWSTRLSEVGSGVTARRIFADLAKGPNDQMDLVAQAFHAGMMPVISYKLGGDVTGAKAGRYDAAARQAAAAIAAYGKPATVTIWHEPQGDLSAADYVAIQKRLVPLFKVGKIKVGPFLNGWLLDRQADTTFASFAPSSLMSLWNFMGIDTYESGTLASPGAVKPAARIPALVNFEKKRGYNLPIAIGEYNGYSAKSITDAGNAILNTPQVWFGCMWNSTIGKGYTLTGDRLSAFQGTLALAQR